MILSSLSVVLVHALLPGIAALQGDPQAAALARPRASLLPQDEDWSVLRDVDREQLGLLDRLKFVPLDDEGDVWISFGGQARVRGELWRDFGFGQVPPTASRDDELALFRFLAHADLHVGRDFRVLLQGKSALLSDRELPGGKRPTDEDRLDVQQLFADASFGEPGATRFTLRGGRSMLRFGKERLVSPLGWSNTLRAWDGVQGIVERGSWKATGFWTCVVEVDPTGANEADDDNQFYGLYGSRAADGSLPALDLYWLGYHQDGVAFNGTTGDEERHTFGARLGGRFGQSAWDYDVEGAYQLGRIGAGDVSAWMLGSELGRSFVDTRGTPRVWLGYDHASGDDQSGGDVGTFNQLFPLGHAYLGFVDVIGRQNIHAVNLGVSLATSPKLRWALAHHLFWLADTADAIYNAGGGIVRPAGSVDSSWVGNELDLTASYTFDRHLSALLGVSRFFAGDALSDSGSSEDIDFAYVSLQYAF